MELAALPGLEIRLWPRSVPELWCLHPVRSPRSLVLTAWHFGSVSLLFCSQGHVLLGMSSGAGLAPVHQVTRMSALLWGDPHLKAGRGKTPGFSAVSFPRAQHSQDILQLGIRLPVSCCQLLLMNLSWLLLPALLPSVQLVHPDLRNTDQPVSSENLATLCKSRGTQQPDL